ncbi:MAG: TIGR03667 family PPOX class F420-dependent oxidoreductase [Chloroflexi bacterium]|nr:TIGR03667 family PPOX class F420-dependent oxidoreductase [Chloroflexota bacterium]
MSDNIHDFEDLIRDSQFAWFTTVRADGQPQPTPVWFIWDGATFVIYSQPQAQKVRNLRANPKVALSFAGDDEGEEYLVVMGHAAIDAQAPAPKDNAAYMAKYSAGIANIDMTPDSFNATFSLAIRITPMRVRGE